MSVTFPWVYIDLINNIWVFNLAENGNLEYKIMYEEEKWTKEKLIDSGVVAYCTYVEDETIHIVYSNIKNELRYCTMKNKQWLGKLLYSIDDKFIVQDVKIKIVMNKMHIFYLVKVSGGSDHGILMHCIWNGEKTSLNTIADIILPLDSSPYFEIEFGKTKKMSIFFSTDEGGGVALKSCNYVNENWTAAKWLYSVKGEAIEFDVMGDYTKNHILNRWREENMYFLEYVAIDEKGNKSSFRIHESENEIIEPMLVVKDNRLYSSWIEGKKIFYSGFDGEHWNKEKKAEIHENNNVNVYNSIFYLEDYLIEGRKVYVTREPKFQILIPSKFIEAETESSNELAEAEKNHEFIRVIKDKEKLEKEIAFINMQLEKKQGIIREYEENNKSILNKKNNNMFLQLQESIQKELDRIKSQLSEEKELSSNLKGQLKENDERNALLQEQVNVLSEENKKLSDDIELEKNQNFIKRLLRRNSSD